MPQNSEEMGSNLAKTCDFFGPFPAVLVDRFEAAAVAEIISLLISRGFLGEFTGNLHEIYRKFVENYEKFTGNIQEISGKFTRNLRGIYGKTIE